MDATDALEAHAAGKRDATDQLLPLVYDQLRALAGRYMRMEKAGHSLRPSDLVHEAYLRLVDASRVSWQGKTHFFAVSAIQMRRILVEHARAYKTKRRGAGATRVTLGDDITPTSGASLEVLALDEALHKLAELNSRQSQVVELRYFGGLTIRETAFVLGVSEETVKKDWRLARAWLMRELSA